MVHRRLHHPDRPAAIGGIGEREPCRQPAGFGGDRIALVLPPVGGRFVAASGQARPDLRPPRGRRNGQFRNGDRHVSGIPLAAPGHEEPDGGRTRVAAEREARCVERECIERRGKRGGAAVARLHEGVHGLQVVPPRRRHEPPGDRCTEQIREAHLAATAEVDHAPPRRVPRALVRGLDVGVVLEREVGTVHGDHRDFHDGRRQRLLGRRVTRPEQAGAGLLRGPAPSQGRGKRILEHEHRVAADQVAPPDTLPDEGRIVVQPLVVGDEDLVKALVDAGEEDRRSAKPQPVARRTDPVRRVSGRDEELGVRRSRIRGIRASDQGGCQQGSEEEWTSAHLWQI